MFTLDLDKLTAEQRSMVALWEAHLKAELQDRDAHASCGTMVANPYVNHVAVLTGGVGRRQLENYYSRYFIPGQPLDLEIVPISRTVGQDRIVDEFVYRCTHSIPMEWLLPGVPPTGRRLEIAVVVIISFEGARLRASRSTGTRRRCWCSWGCWTRRGSRWPGSRSHAKPSIPRPCPRTS